MTIVKPRTAFVWYCKAMREKLTLNFRSRNGGQDPTAEQLTSALENQWARMSEIGQKKFLKQQILDEARYNLDCLAKEREDGGDG